MNNEQARFILQSYRGVADARDPHFAEALRQAGRDAELAEWFADEQAWDGAIRRKLQQAPAPADLCDTIIESQKKVPARPARPRAGLLALAAALVLLAAVAALWRQFQGPSPGFTAYRTEMIGRVAQGVSLDYQNADLSQIQKWLAKHRGFSGYALPAGLQSKPGIGCRTLSWQGRPVGLICFLVGRNEAVHLFVATRLALADPPPGGPPQFIQHGDWMTASWSQGDVVYLATARTTDPAYLQRFL